MFERLLPKQSTARSASVEKDAVTFARDWTFAGLGTCGAGIDYRVRPFGDFLSR